MNERIARDEMLMQMAEVVAQRGTCSRLQVGAVFAQEGRVVATGYNGAPPGLAHCIHESFTWPDDIHLKKWGDPYFHAVPKWMSKAVEGMDIDQQGFLKPTPGRTYYWDGQTISSREGCGVAEHAERNAVAFAARHGIPLGGSDLYCTHAPCLACARTLVSVGIGRLYYRIPYRLTDGLRLLSSVGIELIDMSSND